MPYLILVLLIIIVMMIYLISDKALMITNSYEALDAKRAEIFSILKKRQAYILETYPNLESNELFNDINKMAKLDERIELELSFDFDDESNAYLDEVKALINEYNQMLEAHQALCTKHQLLTKIYHYTSHHKL